MCCKATAFRYLCPPAFSNYILLTDLNPWSPNLYIRGKCMLRVNLASRRESGGFSQSPRIVVALAIMACSLYWTGCAGFSQGSLPSPQTVLPSASVGTSYQDTLSVSGALPPYSFGVSQGQLPAGLSLDSDNPEAFLEFQPGQARSLSRLRSHGRSYRLGPGGNFQRLGSTRLCSVGPGRRQPCHSSDFATRSVGGSWWEDPIQRCGQQRQ